MISHEIIVVKPPVYQTNIVPWRDHSKPNPDVKSQADLDKFLETFGIKEGDYVTYRIQSIIGSDAGYAVLQVLKVQRDFEQMTIKSYGPHNPELLQLRNLNGMERWDDIVNVRKITDSEYQNVVVPHLAKLRDNCQSSA